MRKQAAAANLALAQKAKARRLAAVKAAKPANVICRIFGRYCHEALAVSRCESGLDTTAQNGQYLGLFQMGSNARQLFGHGPSALAQAKAAHRYFVASGNGWGPWSCKPVLTEDRTFRVQTAEPGSRAGFPRHTRHGRCP